MAETLDLGNGYSLSFDEHAAAEAIEKTRASFAKLKADAAVQAALAKAQSVEEAYDAVVSYVNCTLDEFRTLFDEVAHKTYEAELAAGPKEELTEEELDVVAGGGFWGWLKRNIKNVAEAALGLVVAAAGGALIGAGVALCTTGVGVGVGVACIIGGAGMAGAGAYGVVEGVKAML